MNAVEWWEVPDGTELSPEQMVEQFLSLSVVDRINYMALVRVRDRRSSQCAQQNHAGAVWYAINHRCPPPTKRVHQLLHKGRKP